MKKRTKKIFAVSAISVMLLSGLATGIGYISYNKDSSSSVSKNTTKPVSKEEQKSLVDEIIKMVNMGYRPSEIEPKVKKYIDELDKESSTRMVREFMESINSASNYFAQVLYFMGPEMEYAKEVDQVENPAKNVNDLSSDFVKGYLKEAKRQHLVLKPLSGHYYIEPNAKYVLDEYGSYIHGDYKDFLNLAVKQQTDPIFDEEKEMYNVARLKEDLESIALSRDRWSEGGYAEDFKGMEKLLYETLFSVNHTTFFDLKIENEGTDKEEYIYTLKDDIRKELESLILQNSETTLSKETEEYLNVLKDNNYQLNDKVEAYLEDFFEEKFDLATQEEGEVEENKAKDKTSK